MIYPQTLPPLAGTSLCPHPVIPKQEGQAVKARQANQSVHNPRQHGGRPHGLSSKHGGNQVPLEKPHQQPVQCTDDHEEQSQQANSLGNPLLRVLS